MIVSVCSGAVSAAGVTGAVSLRSATTSGWLEAASGAAGAVAAAPGEAEAGATAATGTGGYFLVMYVCHATRPMTLRVMAIQACLSIAAARAQSARRTDTLSLKTPACQGPPFVRDMHPSSC